MKKKKIAYIAATVLFVLAILPGAIMNLTQPEIVVTMSETLGIPLFVMTLMGMWKVLGIAALVTPRFRRINEWAYAGFFFDLTGAAFVHAAAGDTANVPAPLVILCFLVASYVLRPRVEAATSTEAARAEGSSRVPLVAS